MAEWPGVAETASEWPGVPESAAAEKWPGVPESTTPPAGSPGSFRRGLVSSLTQGNPEAAAEFFEGWSHDAPGFLQGPMQGVSRKIREYSKDLTPEGHERLTQSMYDVKDAQQALDWGMETLGSGIGTSIPSLLGAGAGAGIGAVAAGPVGAIGGGIVGAGSTSYMQNYGEVYKALKDEKIDPQIAHDYAKKWAVPIAALDVASLGTIASRFGGAAAAKRELTKSLAKRIAKEVTTGTVTEASTEALQELGKELAITHATTGEIGAPREGVGWKMLEAGVAGGIAGGPMAAPSAFRTGAAPPTGTPGEAYEATVGGQPPEGPSAMEDLLYKSQFSREQVENMLVGNLNQLGSIEKTISDPVERRRNPEMFAHLEGQAESLRTEIEAQSAWLRTAQPAEPGPLKIIVRPPGVEPLGPEAGIDISSAGKGGGRAAPLPEPLMPPVEMAVPTNVPAPAGPTIIENYAVQNPDAPGGVIEVAVERGADGGMVSFRPSFGRSYVVPPEYRLAPTDITLAMKYGPRTGVDKRNVTRIDPIGDENKVSVDPSTIQIEPQKTPITPEEEASTERLMDRLEDVRPARQEREGEFRGTPGANVGALASVLSSNLYGDPGEMAYVTMKEMYQNAFDAIKDTFALGRTDPGNINIDVDERGRTISMTDDGVGMPASVMGKEFMTIAGSKKISKRASGGLGIAKMMVLLENENIKVTSMHKGTVAETSFTGPQFRASFDDAAQAPVITVRKPTEADKALFPQGHGTSITVSVPRTWTDDQGDAKNIHFPYYPSHHDFPALRLSPLLENINVKFNGNEVPAGASFPATEYVPFTNAKFGWGEARIIVSANESNALGYYNTHVLSNGIWQFSMRVEAGRGQEIPREIYIDVAPRVTPREAGYPFELNRQGFSPKVRKDFDKVLHGLRMMYQRVEMVSDAASFGSMEYLDFEGGRVVNTGQFKLHLPLRKQTNIPSEIRREGNNIVVHEGVLTVNGKVIPELSGDELQDLQVDTSDLKIPQDQIPSDRIILHDNVVVTPTGAPLRSTSARVSMTQYGVMKHGQRFYDYVHQIGHLFRELRDVVSFLPDPQTIEGGLQMPHYGELKNQAIGISLDRNYRGVSIRLPFSGSFLNPFVPKFPDAVRAGSGMWMTMLHEFAHLTHRSEKDLAPFIQDLVTRLLSEQGVWTLEFLNRIANTVNQYHDVMSDLRSLFNEQSVEPAGRSFEVGTQQRTDGGGYRNADGSSSARPPKGSELRDWVAIGESSSGRRAGPADGNLAATGAGDPSFGRDANERALRAEVGHDDVAAYQRTGATAPIRNTVGKVFRGKGGTPPGVQAMAAHADKINIMDEYAAGLLELLLKNRTHQPLIDYTQVVRLKDLEESRWQDLGVTIAKKWRSLGTKNGDILGNFYNDMANMVYLTPAERAAGVTRQPTPQEFQQLLARHKMNARTQGVYRDVQNHFNIGLQLEAQNASDHARRTITDPVKLSDALNGIAATTAKLRERPYFPFMRFGTHFITVRDPATNKVEFFELYDRQGTKSAKKVQADALARIRRQFPTYPEDSFKWGVMPPDVGPLFGLSPTMLDHMKDKLQLSTAQLDALEQIKYQMSPALSFKHRFQHKGYVPGYSRDFLRAFSSWSFHSARYYANTKYLWELEQQVKLAGERNGEQAGRIRNYMLDHLQNTVLSVKSDYGRAKGFAFFMHLGFNPAAALYNMFSIVTGAWSHMAAHHGNVRATAAMLKAMFNVTSFYKRGNLSGTTDFQLRALGYGILTGRVSETQAAELAGLANGNGLMYGFGGTNFQRAAHWAQEKSAFLFENAEQFVRRVTYRAALDLATRAPTNRAVQEAVRLQTREHQNLTTGVNTGPSRHAFSPSEANAILYANETVDRTAYVYKAWARPRMMRGAGGLILIFKRFLQSVVYAFLNADRGYRTRWLLTSIAMFGIFGVPGGEELRGIMQGMFKWFGYNVDIETEISKHILQWTDGTVSPDVMLHGLARRGFGIPWMLDMAGSYVTGRPGRGFMDPGPGQNVPFPMLDLSKGSTPQLSPVDMGKMISPYQDSDKMIVKGVEGAAGAAFSPAFNMYRAIFNSKLEGDDFKRWEKPMPKALANMSKAFRIYAEERERAPRGGPAGAKTQLSYDVRDSEQLMEIVAQMLGFTTLRQSREWDFTRAKLEHLAFVKGSRQGIMEQFYEAVMSEDENELESVKRDIERFNEKVRGTPDAGYALTAEGLKTSLRNRILEKKMEEAGFAREKRQIPIIQDLREVYPPAVFPKGMIDVQRR